ncbi:MAG: 3-phosphoserine/phosphohydroxythreonine transaminase [Vicinamibacteria bacterium]|nr:3-phosphoserine/phosphohydroxythreonine transaminase [Vicinamibacteria bacterium]
MSTTPTARPRVHNFSAGPAVLPLPVLERIREQIVDTAGAGMSILEMSHRSTHFEAIIQKAEADLRTLLGIADTHAVLFLQGGATHQFTMVPANLRAAGKSADYVLTGHWSKAALKEAQKGGAARVAGSTEGEQFARIPKASEIDAAADAAYLHYTSNNTIYGTEWSDEPVPPAGVPLVCDASSDFLSRPIDVSKYGLIYAGAQKNVGPAGVVVTIIRKDLLERTPANLPASLDYALYAKNGSMYNTPPCFAIWAVGLVLEHLLAEGGLAEMQKHNERKAGLIYDVIDGSGGFYRGHAAKDSRSKMNITFRLPSEDLEKKFAKESTAAGLDGLKGHRSVGGLRASVYNALPLASAEALVSFMKEFQAKNG